MPDVMKILMERGFVAFVDDPDFFSSLTTHKTKTYIGYDPTAKSLHVGNLLTLMGLAHFQRAGHTPITLIGGGTGLIGDPSGKSEERVLLNLDTVKANQEQIKKQMSLVLDFDCGKNSAIMANNFDWISELSFVDFLRKVGKHFRVTEMLNKESVKKRIGTVEGISLTEFCYQTLQAYDFYQLNVRHGCEVQAGGMDQWGNIAAGIDLTRRLSGHKVHGLCFPLLTKADGSKFGKTESGTVWLDPELTSPFEYYQYWMQTDDRDVIHHLKLFTFLEMEQIAQLEQSLANHPELRQSQKTLAYEATVLIHGNDEADKAKTASEKLFSGDLKGLSDSQLLVIFPDVPSTKIPKADLAAGILLVDVLAQTGLCKSKGDAKRQVISGGVYLNNQREEDTEKILSPDDLASEHFMILRRGKKKYHVLQFDD